MRALVDTAGVRVRLECELPWAWRLLKECCGDSLQQDTSLVAGDQAIEVTVEASREPFDTSRLRVLTRSAWSGGGELVVRDVCTSGFDLRLVVADGRARAAYRWRPPPRTRAASMALRARFHLLARAALLQYPAMWWASTRGAVPLHAAACSAGSATALIAGPGGVGKTSLLCRELEAGGRVAADNLCVSDGRRCWGVVEPLRIDAKTLLAGAAARRGRRMLHDRYEAPLRERAQSLTPDLVVVLRRASEPTASVRPCTAQRAARELAGGTYMAGELRRYWQFAATLAVATGAGPVHPPVWEIAERVACRLPSVELAVSPGCDVSLRTLLSAAQPSVCA